jgi:O-ureido-D-serine cyclo-ligase
VVAALPGLFGLGEPLAYARIDLIRAPDGSPRLLELELSEPSLFFNYCEGSARRFAESLQLR